MIILEPIEHNYELQPHIIDDNLLYFVHKDKIISPWNTRHKRVVLFKTLYTQLNLTCSVIQSNHTLELTESKNEVPWSDEGFDLSDQQKYSTDDKFNDNMMKSAQSQVHQKQKRTFNFQL